MDTLPQLQNKAFKRYARIYANIYERFLQQIKGNGVPMDKNLAAESRVLRQQLEAQQAIFCNNNHSIYINWISSACEACRKGIGSVSFFLSLQCHRHCYYCFNPNQENFEYFSKNKRDWLQELEYMHKSGQKVTHLALTGGEPLLYKKETAEFFRYAREKFGQAHARLYTSGDLLDVDTLEDLKNTGLNEIRFSIKLEDSREAVNKVLANIQLAREYIPHVVIEMPVIPGSLEVMKELLLRLEQLEIDGINLLEFCFPLYNGQEFQKRSFMIKNPPYQVLYDYWYAGGLPVSRSEIECLELVKFALDTNLTIGVHYCSLENKHTGQVFQQNSNRKFSELMYLSPKDYFLKTAKVFGEDSKLVLQVFKKNNIFHFQFNKEHDFLEFHVKELRYLKDFDIEIGICSGIMEDRPDGQYIRELKIELSYPKIFDIHFI
jgi:pyruvate formate-lyase activating enzyme-like uncharacterized protein